MKREEIERALQKVTLDSIANGNRTEAAVAEFRAAVVLGDGVAVADCRARLHALLDAQLDLTASAVSFHKMLITGSM